MRVGPLLLAVFVASAAGLVAQSDARGALLSQTAQRERRLALVIGNDAYASGQCRSPSSPDVGRFRRRLVQLVT